MRTREDRRLQRSLYLMFGRWVSVGSFISFAGRRIAESKGERERQCREEGVLEAGVVELEKRDWCT